MDGRKQYGAIRSSLFVSMIRSLSFFPVKAFPLHDPESSLDLNASLAVNQNSTLQAEWGREPRLGSFP